MIAPYNYIENTVSILDKLNTTISIEYLKNDYHFVGDKDKRDIYHVTLKRGNRSYSFNFGNSLIDSQHYVDNYVKGRSYTMNGGNLQGGYKVGDIEKYIREGGVTLVKGKQPSEYDVIACLQKYDVGSFEDFCSNFGYDTDSRSAKKIYKAVVKEYEGLCTLFTDKDLELLATIE